MIGNNSKVLVRQNPLRSRYAEEPERALIRKRAWTVTSADSDALHSVVVPGEPYDLSWRCGVDRAIGGDHDLPNPAELLCAALAACEDTTIRMVADLLGIEIVDLVVDVTGDVDVRGCMGVDPKVQVGFRSMRCDVRLSVAPGTDARRLAMLRKQAERSCVNLDTLRTGIPVDLSFDVAS